MNQVNNQTAIQIRDIEEARHFYREVLGCLEGQSDAQRLDLSLYGRPIVCNFNPQLGKQGRVSSDYRLMDGKYRPMARCCVVLQMKEWRALAGRLRKYGVKFVIEPLHVNGISRGQATLSLLDPSGNALELKSIRDHAEHLSPQERLKAFGKRVFWVALVASIPVCWILVQNRPATHEIVTGNVVIPVQVPPCTSGGFCIP